MPAPVASEGVPGGPESVPLIPFACPACRKNFRARTELAGNKIKCPRCGQLVRIPRVEPKVASPAPAGRVPLSPGLVLGLVLLATFLLKLRHLDHTGLTRWDEVFHAVVAQNLLKHPLKPTLFDTPYLPYKTTNWSENHVWLHKPILPLWQIALSFAILGVNTLALRLPSALLSTGAAWLTYLIGKELLDRRAALLAAVLQAVNPFLLALVHGYHFADHIDVALLFWVEVGVYLLARSLRTGSWRDVLLAGVAQGLAFLCKSYLAAIVLGIALTAWLLPLCRLGKREDCRIGPARLLGLLAATVLTVAPWLIYCLICYPQEFWHEETQVWKHLSGNVENWAAPWDRVVFDYLIALHGVFYTPILVAGVVLLGKAFAHRHTGLWLVYAWGLGVVLPHLVAVTKTPSATLLGMPPLLLLLGYLVSEAWRGVERPDGRDPCQAGELSSLISRVSLAALTAVLTLSVLFPAVVKKPGYGYPSPRVFGGVMRQSLWVIDHVTGALAVVAVVIFLGVFSRRRLAAVGGPVRRFLQVTTFVFCLCVLAWLGIETARAAWRVTDANVNDPSWVDVGLYARDHLPDNAVLLCQGWKGHEHLTTMFYADRTCYALGPLGPDEMARQVLRAGGIPYLVSHWKLPLSAVYGSDRPGLTVYLWQPR